MNTVHAYIYDRMKDDATIQTLTGYDPLVEGSTPLVFHRMAQHEQFKGLSASTPAYLVFSTFGGGTTRTANGKARPNRTLSIDVFTRTPTVGSDIYERLVTLLHEHSIETDHYYAQCLLGPDRAIPDPDTRIQHLNVEIQLLNLRRK